MINDRQKRSKYVRKGQSFIQFDISFFLTKRKKSNVTSKVIPLLNIKAIFNTQIDEGIRKEKQDHIKLFLKIVS